MKFSKQQVHKALWARISKQITPGTKDWRDNAEVLQEVFSPNLTQDFIYTNAIKRDMPDGINTYIWPALSSLRGVTGGVRVGWRDEEVLIPSGKAQFKQHRFTPTSLKALIPITFELTEDTMPLLAQVLNQEAVNAVAAAACYEMVYGTDGLKGVCDVDGKYSTAFVSTVTYDTLHKQGREAARAYYGGDNGRWYMSRENYKAWVDAFDGDEGCVAGDLNNLRGYWWGYPITVSPALEANHMLLGDFSQYGIVQKQFKQAFSEHLGFDTATNHMRWTQRISGASLWDGSILARYETPDFSTIDFSATDTGANVYPFVALSTMEIS